MLGHASDPLAIPTVADIGVQKNTAAGPFINIWPIWYNTMPVDIIDHVRAQELTHPSPSKRGKQN